MKVETIKERVINIVVDLFPELNDDKNIIDKLDLLNDCSMDSLTFISLIIAIETEFNITIPDESLNIEKYSTIDNIVSNIISTMQE